MHNFDVIALPGRSETDGNADFIRSCIRLLDKGRRRVDPTSSQEMVELQHKLFHAGRHDIPLGRLFEGHVDALQIVYRYGTAEQLENLQRTLENGTVLGVWNAEGPEHHLAFDGSTLSGSKSYASGAGLLSHALVTSKAGTPDVRLHLVDLAWFPPRIDRSWWSVAGMQHSETHQVSWENAEAIHIGGPGDYEREPWFSGGALRFATVQAGGLAGLLDAVRGHLIKLGRTCDSVQQARLAELHMWSSIATSIVLTAGRVCVDGQSSAVAPTVANARNVVYQCCEQGILLAQRACGTAAYFDDNPVCRFAQDLGMYIRQPGPDAQFAKVGKAVADGSLDPWPCNS